MKCLLSAAVYLSIVRLGFELSCRGWSGARILNNQTLNWSRFFIRDHGHHKMNVMIRLRLIHTGSGRSSMPQILLMMAGSPPRALEGYRRAAAPEADHGFNSMSPHQHSVATQSSALCMKAWHCTKAYPHNQTTGWLLCAGLGSASRISKKCAAHHNNRTRLLVPRSRKQILTHLGAHSNTRPSHQ